MIHPLRYVLIGLLLLTSSGQAGQAPPTLEDPIRLTAEVHGIFEAKCVDCHGPTLAKPKGKFGYVLDLKRLAANPDYIVPGQPAGSDLYDQILHDEMPGEDAKVPPLTAAEKEKVKRWIEIGAPGDLPVTSPATQTTPTAFTVEPPKRVFPFWQQALRWIGKFHPVSTHFPVALMMVAVLAEGLAWWTRRESWWGTVRFLVFVAALGALATASLGWLNAYFSSYNKATGALLWWHRWLGSSASLWALLCAGLILRHPCPEGTPERNRFRAALLVGATLIGIAGFLGSALIYGLDHYSWD